MVPEGQEEAQWLGAATLPGVQVEGLNQVEEAGHGNKHATRPVAKWGTGVAVACLKGLVVGAWQSICEDDIFRCAPTRSFRQSNALVCGVQQTVSNKRFEAAQDLQAPKTRATTKGHHRLGVPCSENRAVKAAERLQKVKQ
jgi:hypothetical protein